MEPENKIMNINNSSSINFDDLKHHCINMIENIDTREEFSEFKQAIEKMNEKIENEKKKLEIDKKRSGLRNNELLQKMKLYSDNSKNRCQRIKLIDEKIDKEIKIINEYLIQNLPEM